MGRSFNGVLVLTKVASMVYENLIRWFDIRANQKMGQCHLGAPFFIHLRCRDFLDLDFVTEILVLAVCFLGLLKSWISSLVQNMGFPALLLAKEVLGTAPICIGFLSVYFCSQWLHFYSHT